MPLQKKKKIVCGKMMILTDYRNVIANIKFN